ncbi:DUF1516 family protein [Fructilactobacillus sanfranciscensis]|uniref:DUF1516 family protein n=1 Tax=Fructilactobacillus sanfranciscensis TaxID=1625 RepID=UPI0030B89034
MYLVWIHLITWMVILVTTIIALFSQSRKLSLISMMITRVGYLFANRNWCIISQSRFSKSPCFNHY